MTTTIGMCRLHNNTAGSEDQLTGSSVKSFCEKRFAGLGGVISK